MRAEARRYLADAEQERRQARDEHAEATAVIDRARSEAEAIRAAAERDGTDIALSNRAETERLQKLAEQLEAQRGEIDVEQSTLAAQRSQTELAQREAHAKSFVPS